MSRSLLTNETSELDLLDQRPFDQTDFDILKSYEAVVDGLAMLIGSHCEIVLHSLQDLKCSAIRIANGEHTGRKIGSPITDLALRMLHDMTGADMPEFCAVRHKLPRCAGVVNRERPSYLRHSDLFEGDAIWPMQR